jgi:hypothetical protein
LNHAEAARNRHKGAQKEGQRDAGQFVRRLGRNSIVVCVPRPLQGAGRQIGKLSREFAAPDKTGGFKKQDQNQQGQGHHEYSDLSIGLMDKIGGLGRGNVGEKRRWNCSCGEKTEGCEKADFLSSGRRRCVHGIDVAMLA